MSGERSKSDLSHGPVGVSPPSRTRIDVISMPTAEQRRTLFADAAQGARAEWRFVTASSSPPAELPYTDQAAILRFGRALSRGEIGCFASHYSVWKSLLASNDRQRIVLEDDTIVDWPLMDRIAEVDYAALDLDLVRFYSTHPFAHSVAIQRFLGPHTHLLQTRGMFLGTQGYVLTRRAAERLVELARDITMPVDWFMTRYWEHGFRNYCLFPFPLIERFVPSEIGDRSYAQPASPVARMVRQGFRVFDRVSRGFADHVRFRGNPFEPTEDAGPSFIERTQPRNTATPALALELQK
jgi:glycosyl transferase family 25